MVARPDWHIEAVALRALGFPVVKIAAKFGVTRYGVYKALTRAKEPRQRPADRAAYMRERMRRLRAARRAEAGQ